MFCVIGTLELLLLLYNGLSMLSVRRHGLAEI
jgi:hypothetical protein